MDDQQLAAVEWNNGPCLVLAGPGSGKTTVITQRILNLIINTHVLPEYILVITFTKEAAMEMEERFHKLLYQSFSSPSRDIGSQVTFGTFHSIFLHILLDNPQYQHYQIMNQQNKKMLFKETLSLMKYEEEEQMDFYDMLQKDISFYKNNHCLKLSSGLSKEQFLVFMKHYEEKKQRYRWMDFDDMLCFTKNLLETSSDTLKMLQNKYRYLLIDEAQDMNDLQYGIVQMICAKHQNLFMVGDDDQSIYGFRGASSKHILSFHETYPQGKMITLKQNYRSQKEIVAASKRCIVCNQNRLEKNQQAYSKEEGIISTYHQSDDKMQAQWIVDYLASTSKKKKIAILVRHQAEKQEIIRMLNRQNISYYCGSDGNKLKEHWAFMDVYYYMQIASGKMSRSNFLQILNRPNKDLSRYGLEKEEITFASWKRYYEQEPYVLHKIEKLESQIQFMSRLSPFSAVLFLRKNMGYDEFVACESIRLSQEEQIAYQVLDELLEESRKYSNLEEFVMFFEKYQLKKQKNVTILKQKNDHNHISIYTYHGAKGLEFDEVILPFMNEGMIPSPKAKTSLEIEEERRMFYVALTRAIDKIILIYIARCGNKVLRPSRFLQEIIPLHNQ